MRSANFLFNLFFEKNSVTTEQSPLSHTDVSLLICFLKKAKLVDLAFQQIHLRLGFTNCELGTNVGDLARLISSISSCVTFEDLSSKTS